jgi:rapamycin-insensitive companion of mTOR
MREDIKLRIEASKMAIVALLKSWPGVYCLCNPSNNGLGSLLEMLPLSKPEVQREILDLFYSMFQLKVPEWTESFTDAVISIGESETISNNNIILT